MADDTAQPPVSSTPEEPDSPSAVTLPNPFAFGDGPLPTSTDKLVAEIKRAAAARQRHALTHRWDCNCDGCIVRRGGQRIELKDIPVDDAA